MSKYNENKYYYKVIIVLILIYVIQYLVIYGYKGYVYTLKWILFTS